MSVSNVAQSFRKAIDEFKRTDPENLRRIDVVIYEKRMVQAFQDALTGQAPSKPSQAKQKPASKSAPKAVKKPLFHVRGGVKVSSGDILSSSCEVLINTTGSDFNLSG